MNESPTVVFGVTDSQSIQLLGEIPRTLALRGWRVIVVASFGTSDLPTESGLVEYRNLRMSRTPALLGDFFSLIRWISLLRETRPLVLSAGTPKASLLAMVASKILRVKWRVYVLRGLRLETASGIKRIGLWLAERITSLLSTSIVSVSQSLSKEYVRLHLSKPAKICVLGKGSSHGVSLAKFSPNRSRSDAQLLKKRLGMRRDVPVLGFFGRFNTEKGADQLPKIRQLLFEWDCSHELLIVGAVEDSFLERTALIQQSPPAVFVGAVKNVADYMEIIDVLILPTKREGFPNVILEASALGIPSISTRTTGAVDAIVNEVTGLIAEKASPTDFAKRVRDLCLDETKRRQLGLNAQRWVSANFSQDVICELHANYIEGLTGQP